MGTRLILEDLVLPSRINQRWQYSGIDSLEFCRDKEYFRNYPHQIDYIYNSRGFRDNEWPNNLADLRSAVWCVGDSFTVGIGQPLVHIWPQLLEKALNRRCINVSMDGASNDWIFRRAADISQQISPSLLIIMWSYIHRRESAEHHRHDEDRRLQSSYATVQDDIRHFQEIINKIQFLPSRVIQMTIPGFMPDEFRRSWIEKIWSDIKDVSWPSCPRDLEALENLPSYIKLELENNHQIYHKLKSLLVTKICETLEQQQIITVDDHLDWARDHHHFDILTSQWVVDQILRRIGD